jgi:ABC-type transport system involved in cytochrome c biogenesis ATPase subunit
MLITRFSYNNKSSNWALEELVLNEINLLVGASGVGKTQILRSIKNLALIADGNSIPGIKWEIEFKTLSDDLYIWEGEFSDNNKSDILDSSDINGQFTNVFADIVYEKLSLNGEIIIDRNKDQIVYEGKPTIKLSRQQSALHILKEEEKIKPSFHCFKKILYSDHSFQMNNDELPLSIDYISIDSLVNKYDSLQKIQNSNLLTVLKLFFIQFADKNTFNKIKSRFIEIFPQVQDIKVSPVKIIDERSQSFSKNRLYIQIKEIGIEHWILPSQISSGMFRTLLQLSELYLCAEGSVFLIDEFENSLGVNCINEITNDILNSNRQLQFIITSHHPYIIDAIGYSNWKLVTRNAGLIKAQNINKFGIGKSKHSAFMQLIQLEEYRTGIA